MMTVGSFIPKIYQKLDEMMITHIQPVNCSILAIWSAAWRKGWSLEEGEEEKSDLQNLPT